MAYFDLIPNLGKARYSFLKTMFFFFFVFFFFFFFAILLLKLVFTMYITASHLSGQDLDGIFPSCFVILHTSSESGTRYRSGAE